MINRIANVAALILCLLILSGCDKAGNSGQTINGWALSSEEHKEVMNLIKKIYKDGIGDRIVAWYGTESRGYFDLQTNEFVKFDAPISTLSVAIPDYVSYTDNIQSKLEQLANATSHDGWRLLKYRVQIDPHGAGGGPSGSYDKVTIFPIQVEKIK